MLEACGEARLLEQPPHPESGVPAHHLHRDRATEVLLHALVDGAHPAFADPRSHHEPLRTIDDAELPAAPGLRVEARGEGSAERRSPVEVAFERDDLVLGELAPDEPAQATIGVARGHVRSLRGHRGEE